ncbi:hypothetical protein B0H14DRAFT_2620869 [Mycena olivaceomarginata]|nr:hypothetical protein B0H14DRAFT_2620869 [Mycena olivaceomarginata]
MQAYRPGDTLGTCGGTGPKDQATRVSGASGFDDILTVGNDISEFIYPECPECLFANECGSNVSFTNYIGGGSIRQLRLLLLGCTHWKRLAMESKIAPKEDQMKTIFLLDDQALWRTCEASSRQQVGGSILMPHPRKFPVADSFGDKLTSGVVLKEDNRNGARLLRLLSG